MATNDHYSYGIRIEGIGSDTSKTGGIVWYIGSPGIVSSTYEWIGGYTTGKGLSRRPRKLLHSVDPYDSSVKDASEVFQIHNTEIARESLLFQETEFFLALSGDVAKSGASTLDLVGTGATGYANQPVWIDDECILLGTHNGSGNYDITTRGLFGTIATKHFDGTAVYSKNNRIYNRLVSLVRYDHSDDTEAIVWRGAVDAEVSTTSNGAGIEVPTRGLFALLRSAQINRVAPNLIADANLKIWHNRDTGNANVYGGMLEPRNGRRVGKTTGGTTRVWLQVDEALIYGVYSGGYMGAPNVYADSFESLDYEDYRGALETSEISEKVYEVFVIARELDEILDDPINTPLTTNGRSVTGILDYPFHPVAISMALLVSTPNGTADASNYDAFGPDWGVGVPINWFDTTAIDNLIEDSAEVKIDRLILGWDGEPVAVMDAVKKVLASTGFYLAPTADGLISFARRRKANVEDLATGTSATPLEITLQWSTNRRGTVDNIRAEVGGYPWREPTILQVAGIDYATGEPLDSFRAAAFSSRNEITLDLSTRSDADASLVSLLNELAERHFATPILRIRVPSGTYDVGAFLSVLDPGVTTGEGSGWWIDKDGNSLLDIDTTGDAQFFGQIIAVDHNIQNGGYEVTLLLTNFRSGAFARYRCPSAYVTSVSTNVLTIQQVFGHSTGDHKQFTVGDFVYIAKPDGSRRAPAGGEIEDITAIGGSTITVRNAFGTPPVQGDIVRLAKLDATGGTGVGYPEGGNASIFSGYLAYTYFGVSGSVGPSSLPAHVYGSERF